MKPSGILGKGFFAPHGVMDRANIAQLVEHFLGKGEVIGSIPIAGSRFVN